MIEPPVHPVDEFYQFVYMTGMVFITAWIFMVLYVIYSTICEKISSIKVERLRYLYGRLRGYRDEI